MAKTLEPRLYLLMSWLIGVNDLSGSVNCSIGHLCPGTGLAALGEVGKQVVNELFLFCLSMIPGATGCVGDIRTCFQVLVQGHQCLVVLLQQYTHIKTRD